MKLKDLEQYIRSLFNTSCNKKFDEESGITVRASEDIKRIGYCTNLNLHTIEGARKNDINLMITHHDAWDFIYGLKDVCREKLLKYNISHYYNHLPLDDCDFGTNNSLAKKLGLEIIEKSNEEDGFYCGRITEFQQPMSFGKLIEKLESILQEPVKAWKFKDGDIKKVGLVCGGGSITDDVKAAVDKECDVYITGEKTLYTIEYAQFKGINLIIGSHTFTEIFGVESLAKKIKERFNDIEIIQLQEEHLEANFYK